ncbi:tripartite tricarboxylate transporter permease [Paracoccus sp. 1_MG-2023]|uniref:tripartite tricarboxylate transporter permease n=1 Tax=unclassified Paracoccus (in: a-proteobacteria) TaxID=2688777 RepID=UPI001C09AEDA|nr:MULTISPECIES: tripartite tricarboxylate transporter permease [unclassified Paracoccus (in: a-proteobacteria)]MBU2959133.1 tripartite tricarboxylate transporter permease [Paracoccus sp. C2R09]MDO6669417.1 tripartite tricarboxylate transporter permease [Paracoccus sp. 1_MG-2023]
METLGHDLINLFTITNMLCILLGTLVGMVFGALPGLGTVIAVALLLPVTFTLPPLAGILMLLATYQAGEYGGSISAILLGVPGTPQAAATVIDGHPMAMNDSPGKALSYSLLSSSVGGIFGGLVLIFVSVPLAKFALNFGSPEYFLLGVIGLLTVALLSGRDKIKSMISVVLGLMAGTVGVDALTGVDRATFGQPELMDGINLVALLVGIFAISELLSMISKGLNISYVADYDRLKTGLTIEEMKGVAKPTMIGSLIGAGTGILPGIGGGAACWFAYAVASKFSKNPGAFGRGSAEGITAPESSNNASAGGALVPFLALGIPGSAAVAIIMGAFVMHGIQPGPGVFAAERDLVYGIFYGFIVTTVAMYLVGRLLTPMFARVLVVPNSFLVAIVLVLCLIGIYASKAAFFDLWLALAIGVLFYILKRLEYSVSSVIIAYVLAPIIEENFRRSLNLSNGSYDIFVSGPYSILLVMMIFGALTASIHGGIKRRQNLEPY